MAVCSNHEITAKTAKDGKKMVASSIGVIMHGVMGNDDRNKC
jgi:hypothetical protein